MKPCPKPARKKRNYKRPAVLESVPLEDTEQKTVVDWLELNKVWFTANTPDRRFCNRLGYKKGVPDILIFDRPSMVENGLLYVGAAIEMKRRKGGQVSKEQEEWLHKLTERGWKCFIARGCDEAIKFLEECGYGYYKPNFI